MTKKRGEGIKAGEDCALTGRELVWSSRGRGGAADDESWRAASVAVGEVRGEGVVSSPSRSSSSCVATRTPTAQLLDESLLAAVATGRVDSVGAATAAATWQK